MNDYTQLVAVLVWLTSGGALLAANWLVANLLEKWDKWHGLPKEAKFLIPLGLAVLLAIGAQVALQYQDALAPVQQWFALIVTVVLAYFGSQKGHQETKSAKGQG